MSVIPLWLVILAILVLLALAKKMLPYTAILAISFGCGIVLQFIQMIVIGMYLHHTHQLMGGFATLSLIAIPIVASLLISYVCYRNDLRYILSVLMLTTIFALWCLRMMFLR